MLFVSLLVLIFSYALACAWLSWQWLKIPVRPAATTILPANVSISVIIPVRNEAAYIGALLEDLTHQTLPKSSFEIIVVNDASTDSTAQIVKEFQSRLQLNLKLIDLPEIPTASPKKRAITAALQEATGKLIVTTDGDCRVGEAWLATIALTHAQTGAKFISGPVTFISQFSSNKSKIWSQWWESFQTIEFSSLIGTGACLLEAGYPTMCNGANLAYERAAFEAVGGYEGVTHLASGDDEFLLQKISQRFPNQICFLKNVDAIVQTQPQPSWRAFYQQRVRWASKWAANGRVATMLVALFVFLVNAATLGILVSLLFEGSIAYSSLMLLILKFSVEFIFLAMVLLFLGKQRLILAVPLLQLIYPFYVLFFGLAAQQKGYEWKGRKLK